MGLLDRLDAIDQRLHLRRARPAGTAEEEIQRLACRVCRFFRRHGMVFWALIVLDVLGIVSAIGRVTGGGTTSRQVYAASELVGSITSAGMWVALRRGLPRRALDLCLAGVSSTLVATVVIGLLRGRPAVLVVAIVPLALVLAAAGMVRQRIPSRCQDA